MKDHHGAHRQAFLDEYVVNKPLVGLFLLTALTVFSYRFIDTPIFIFFHRFIRAHALTPLVARIPDLLFYFVVVTTVTSWTGYWYRVRHGFADSHADFLKLCGIAVPLAFLSKTILQYLFGRTNPEFWLVYHYAAQFHWFRAGEGYGCFPSGHMTVFTALTAALWRHYPRHRIAYLGFLLALAFALIATNHHFLSDVVAGAYLGAAICFVADRAVGRHGAPG